MRSHPSTTTSTRALALGALCLTLSLGASTAAHGAELTLRGKSDVHVGKLESVTARAIAANKMELDLQGANGLRCRVYFGDGEVGVGFGLYREIANTMRAEDLYVTCFFNADGNEARVDFGSRLSSIELLRGRAPVTCTAELTSYGSKKIKVIKAIQGITRKDLKTTTKLVESTPSVLLTNVPRARAIAAASALERVGAKARVKCR